MKKKSRKKLLLIIIGLLVVIAALGIANFAPMLSMQPLPTGPIAGTKILAVNSKLGNMFLIPSPEGYIAIDAGTDAGLVQSGLAELGIDPADISAILLTHSDYDHVASLALFANAHIYMSAEEKQMVDGTTKRNAISRNSLPAGVDLERIILLTDGMLLNLDGHKISCAQAPGHTPGSMTYLLDWAYLFSGDMLRVSDNTIKLHPYTMDQAQAQKSLQIIEELRYSNPLVLTAHYGCFAAQDLQAK